ncbi:MAG: ferredoxin, partial [Methylococcales bacterium]|nr:ferredoxin [Methylococcales bacterium]
KLADQNKPSGPYKTKNGYTVYINRSLCIGAATCVAVSPKGFEMDSDAKAVILKTADSDNIENIVDAARSCPTAAIFITDDMGNKIFPK